MSGEHPQEQPSEVERFQAETGITAVKTEEQRATLSAVAQFADKFIAGLEESTWCNTNDRIQVAQMWEGAVPLSQAQREQYATFISQPLEKLKGEVLQFMSEHPALYEEKKRHLEAVLDDIETRVQFLHEKMKGTFAAHLMSGVLHTQFKTMGIEAGNFNYFIVSSETLAEFSSKGRENNVPLPPLARALAIEESLHLVSQLSVYGEVVGSQWVEELMARILGYSSPFGYVTWDIAEQMEIDAVINLSGCLNLMDRIRADLSEEQYRLLFFCFFGFVNAENRTEEIVELEKVLSKYSYDGTMMLAGI